MKCVRCGYCCTRLLAVVIKDPEGELAEPNLMTIGMTGEHERCPHLRGDKPGEFSCFVHDKPWYPETPCADYQSHWPEMTCRVGKFLLSEEAAAYKAQMAKT